MNKRNLSDKRIIFPYNLLAERLVLGNLITIPDAISLVSEKLPIKAFYLENHQIIYKGLLTIYAEGKTLDYINLITWLQDNGLLIKIGGSQVLLNLLNQINKSSNLEEYIALIFEKYLRRSLIQLGEEIIEMGYLTDLPLETIFRKIEQNFFVLTTTKPIQNLISVQQGFEHILGEIEQGLRLSEPPGLKTTFVDFDVITQGFQNSELIIIAGRPSMGKTAFAFNIAKNIAYTHDIPVIFFSLEMTREQLLYRLLASEAEITNTRLRSSRIKKTEWITIKALVTQLSQLKLFIDDTPNLSIGEIKVKIKTLNFTLSKEISLIVIDYLQLLDTNEKNDNRVQELTKITRALKKLARDLKIPIIVLSQLSRNVESRLNKRPVLSDLRESGCLYFNNLTKINSKKISLVFCWSNRFLSKQNILQLKFTGQKPTYMIKTMLGWSLVVSGQHKLLTNQGWRKVDQVTISNFIGTKLLIPFLFPKETQEICWLTWDKIIKINYFNVVPVYDFQITKSSNFLSNHIFIHNSIEQDADMVIMLYRDEYYNKNTLNKNIIEVIIAKHRNGPIGSTNLIFDAKYLRFFNK